MKYHIGTSGYIYKHWWGVFYPERFREREALEYYSRHFHTVEINNSFYNLPAATTFHGWHKRTPQGFIFAVKASRYITHMKKLKDPGKSTRTFLERVGSLGEKLGPLLFQLPPRWNANIERLTEFLHYLRQNASQELRIVFEFRNNSWINEELFDILSRYRAGFCIHDMHGIRCPDVATADFVYYRFHGPSKAPYDGRYSTLQIKEAARRVKDHIAAGREVYAYFNNDIGGYAVENARMLIKELNR